MPRLTLLDIAKANGSDAVAGLIDETVKAHPELTVATARTIEGINYKTLVRTSKFDGSTFRSPNEGATVGKATYENRLVETFILNPRWEADKAVADSYEDGASAYIAMEAESMVEKAMVDICAQFYYGTNTTYGGNAKGFPGVIDAYDSTNNVVDAGGTTADTGSSVWLVKFGPKGVQWVWGKGGELLVPEPRIETIYDGSSNPLTGYVQDLLARPGLQVGSVRSAVRIKKLTADSGKGLTDSLIVDALAKFEVGIVPDAIFMSRRSRAQLQKSRSVTIFSGAGSKADGKTENVGQVPTESQGIPIYVTDAIKDTEALTL
jgi:hypothetical protein